MDAVEFTLLTCCRVFESMADRGAYQDLLSSTAHTGASFADTAPLTLEVLNKEAAQVNFENPIAQWMREHGFDLDKSDMLIMHEAATKLFGVDISDLPYVLRSPIADELVMIKGTRCAED